ncbi:MAG: transcriptional activator NhaR, partial [Deltaproteobacteria bacterium]|nr:transcriptional activator NhaR [Deltaproteobacteria bacterium]
MEWLNYHHLFYFWTVMKEGGVTAAGKRLRLSPSTVSAQITALEQALDAKLFRRVGRGLVPTDLGRTVFVYADEIFSLGREMMDTIRGRPVVGPLSLKVGVVDVLPKLMVRRILEPVFGLSEQVHLVCYENKEHALLADLAVHRLDMVLSDAPVQKGLPIKAYNHFLGECGVTFFAAEKLANTVREEFPQSLDQAPVLLPLEMTALRQSQQRWFDAIGVNPLIVAEFEDSALLKEFGQHGDGIFAAPSVIEKQVCRQYQVQIVGRTGAVREQFYAISLERII